MESFMIIDQERRRRYNARELEKSILKVSKKCRGQLLPRSVDSTLWSFPFSRRNKKILSQEGPLFSKLSAEIRLRIYGYVMRDIKIHLLKPGFDQELVGQVCRGSDYFLDTAYDCCQAETLSAFEPRIALLYTCRQIYVEALPTVYSNCTFVLRGQTPGCNFPYALLFLPSHIKPQRLQQIRSLQIQWCAMRNFNQYWDISRSWPPPAKFASEYWQQCWEVLAGMKGLEELVVEFLVGTVWKEDWKREQAAALEGAKAIKVKESFIIVLPFDDCVVDIDFGGSRCHFQLPGVDSTRTTARD
ncbi:hypothetical protein BDV96DRAFT_681716 [Lophiotrema nucula]|uniref:DUF7730 domain-containing protein n=1 Tax=Lophiotrema nucula TaxID=690887 RepID=A0A6A5ZU25_9PLEO|nr:hypothetical protein BDV96DRAFT_681716 [Lophiotrema nucula]